MKGLAIVGVLLVVLGLVGLIYGGITYTKDSDTVDLGIAEITVTDKERLNIHPALGGIVLAAGLVVLVIGLRGKKSLV